jgi:hypothetical protein
MNSATGHTMPAPADSLLTASGKGSHTTTAFLSSDNKKYLTFHVLCGEEIRDTGKPPANGISTLVVRYQGICRGGE